MNDVAGFTVRATLKLAMTAGVPIAPLLEGMPFDEHSIKRVRRVSWDHYCDLAERLERAVGGPDAFDALVEKSYSNGFPPSIRSITGSFVSPKQLLRFIYKTIDPVVFPNTDFTYDELADGRVRVGCRMHPHLRPCLAITRGTIAALRNLPTHLGLPLADVEVEELTPSACVAVVRMPASRTLVARTQRRVRNDLLELLALFSGESRQHTDRLASVAALGRDLARCEDLSALGQSILAMLHAAGWSHVALYAGDQLVASRPGQVTQVLPLALAGRAVGRLEVGGRGDGELLADLVPWLAIAVDKARGAGATARTRAERLARVADQLTAKQLEVLERVVAGLGNKEIATELGCAENTVEYHVTQLLRKLRAENRLRLIAGFWAE